MFKEAYANFIYSEADAEYSSHVDLRIMVDQFVKDLSAGKKVVLVSHSQGNFFSNNAYAYIVARYPEYLSSIGIVAVGTPASFVAGNGLVTQNSQDAIIFSLVNSVLGFDVVPANVSINGPNDPINHAFIDTYMLKSSAKIVSDVRTMINRLEQPEISAECDEKIAKVTTLNASNVTDSAATLRGRLTDGENADVWFVHGSASSVSCDSQTFDGVGSHTAETIVDENISNLKSNTTYIYKACALGAEGRVSDGGLIQFITTRSSAKITNAGATSIGVTSATLRGSLTSGIGVDVWFRWGLQNTTLACNGDSYNGRGNESAPSVVSKTITNLAAGTTYKYIACAKGTNGVTNSSAEETFTTNVPEQSCSDAAYVGDTSGLSITYDFGTKRGIATVGFEAFEIADKFEIYKHNTNTRLLYSPGFVRGYKFQIYPQSQMLQTQLLQCLFLYQNHM